MEGLNFNAKFAYKNLFVISSTFFLLFTAFAALQNLQSSIHTDANSGFIYLCAIYVSFLIGSLLLPPFILHRFGCKKALMLGISGYIAFILAHFYAEIWLMVIASTFVGVCAAILWSAESTYINIISMKYATKIGESKEKIVSKFVCVLLGFVNGAQVIGNLLSSSVLQRKSKLKGFNNTDNATLECGKLFCPSESSQFEITGQAEISTIFILVAIYAGCSFLAFLTVLLFLSPVDIDVNESRQYTTALSLFTSTLKLLIDRKTLLLIPLTIYIGMLEGFTFADFPKAYVTCAIGIENVGYVMMCYGISSGGISMLLAFLVKWSGTCKIMIYGLLINACVLVWSVFVNIAESYKIYALAVLFGISNVCILSQLFTNYGIHFATRQTEAFALLNVFKNLGYVIEFSHGNLTCTRTKLYIMMVFLVGGGICYVALEHSYPTDQLAEKKKKRKVFSTEDYIKEMSVNNINTEKTE